jgi:hypothetical protein
MMRRGGDTGRIDAAPCVWGGGALSVRRHRQDTEHERRVGVVKEGKNSVEALANPSSPKETENDLGEEGLSSSIRNLILNLGSLDP